MLAGNIVHWELTSYASVSKIWDEFGLSDTELGLLGGISLPLFYATMGVPIARLSDQWPGHPIIIITAWSFPDPAFKYLLPDLEVTWFCALAFREAGVRQ